MEFNSFASIAVMDTPSLLCVVICKRRCAIDRMCHLKALRRHDLLSLNLGNLVSVTSQSVTSVSCSSAIAFVQAPYRVSPLPQALVRTNFVTVRVRVTYGQCEGYGQGEGYGLPQALVRTNFVTKFVSAPYVSDQVGRIKGVLRAY